LLRDTHREVKEQMFSGYINSKKDANPGISAKSFLYPMFSSHWLFPPQRGKSRCTMTRFNQILEKPYPNPVLKDFLRVMARHD